MFNPDFLVAIFSVILIDLVLSGDNAIVIALACHALPHKQKKQAVFFGSLGAIVMRLLLSFIAVWLMTVPLLKAVAGLLLLWIAVRLLAPPKEHKVGSASSLLGAIKTIIIADFVMSLDNVVAVVATAKGNWVVVLIGIGITIPLIIWGSQIIMRLMNRFAVIIYIGAALLGWTGAEMLLRDHYLMSRIGEFPQWIEWGIQLVVALFVVIIGRYLARRTVAR